MWTAETVLMCALTLLGRSEASFPLVRFVDVAPPGVSSAALAYTRNGSADITIITSGSAFDLATRALDRCGNVEALREIAGVLAHEEWHVRHGTDEGGAYDAQLTALLFAGANQNGRLYHQVVKAKLAVLAARRRDSQTAVMARRGP